MRGNVASTPHLRRIGSAITIGSVAAILFATMLPASGQLVGSHLCLVCGTRGGVDVILNILLFIPLGIGLALSGTAWNRAILIACALSVTVETVQFFFIPGRDATLGDVLTNTIGGAVGFAVASNAANRLRTATPIVAILGAGWCIAWLAIQAMSSFAFAPSIADSKYYGQIARTLGDFAVFPGKVLEARIGDVPITDMQLKNVDSVGRRLLGGATVSAIVMATEPTDGIAPIVRVTDDEQREIVVLAQDEQSLVFGVRTGAATLRLRPPLFVITGVFPSGIAKTISFPADPLRLSASYNGREAQLAAGIGSVSHHVRIPVSASLGWTLVLPFQWYIEDTRTELLISLIWIACLALPIGYLGASIARSNDQRGTATLVVLCLLAGAATLITGLFVVQHAFGVRTAPVRDWLAAISGILVGGGIATRNWKRRGFPSGTGRRNLVNRATTQLRRAFLQLDGRMTPSE
ncbi:MAG TPA: VanZ family protein [Gemmatimonadaceae bacterium]|nr:VanZ family protein [Gemmatimonadaceae bacterium]